MIELDHFHLPSSLVHWSYQRKITQEINKSVEVNANKALKIKSAYHCTDMQISSVKVLLLK